MNMLTYSTCNRPKNDHTLASLVKRKCRWAREREKAAGRPLGNEDDRYNTS